MSVEWLINFEGSMPKTFNTPWDSVFLFKKIFSKKEIYIWKNHIFRTNIIFFRAAKVTMACQWVPYYLGYKIVEIPQGLYKVWIYVRKAKMFLKRCMQLYFTAFSCEPTQNSILQYMSLYNEMHSGTRREIRACRLVTCPRKAGFGEQGFVFQFCDNQNLGQIFWKPSNLH